MKYLSKLILLTILFSCNKKGSINYDLVTQIESIDIIEQVEFSYNGVNPINVQQVGDTVIVNYYPENSKLYFYSLRKKNSH